MNSNFLKTNSSKEKILSQRILAVLLTLLICIVKLLDKTIIIYSPQKKKVHFSVSSPIFIFIYFVLICFCLLLFFETQLHTVVQAGIQFKIILLPQPLKYENCRYEPLCPASSILNSIFKILKALLFFDFQLFHC